MIKLIATDMDGTLLDDCGRVDDKVIDLIPQLDKIGIQFSAASGRTCLQLSKNFRNVKSDIIFIAHNGALIKYSRNGKVIYSSSIFNEDVRSTIELNFNINSEIFISGENLTYVKAPSRELMGVLKEYNADFIDLKSFSYIDEPVYKISYYIKDGINRNVIEYIEENLSPNLEFVPSADGLIDIMNKGISKGKAIEILQQKFNINRKNTMVFGDYYNDLTMFKAAHYSYAMKNAPEDVKKYANFETDSNNDNGVYRIISKCSLIG